MTITCATENSLVARCAAFGSTSLSLRPYTSSVGASTQPASAHGRSGPRSMYVASSPCVDPTNASRIHGSESRRARLLLGLGAALRVQPRRVGVAQVERGLHPLVRLHLLVPVEQHVAHPRHRHHRDVHVRQVRAQVGQRRRDQAQRAHQVRPPRGHLQRDRPAHRVAEQVHRLPGEQRLDRRHHRRRCARRWSSPVEPAARSPRTRGGPATRTRAGRPARRPGPPSSASCRPARGPSPPARAARRPARASAARRSPPPTSR